MKGTISLNLPPTLRKWVEEQLTEGQEPGDFLEQLLRKEQKTRLLRERIEVNLHEALDSGPCTEMTAADFQKIRRDGRKRIVAKKPGRRKPS